MTARRHDRQRRHAQPLEVPVVAEALDQLHRGGHVDREEHAGLRRRGHAADHGLGHVLLDAPYRRPRLAGTVSAVGTTRRAGQMGGQVLARDDAAGPVAGDVGEVDPVLPGHEPDRRRGQRPGSGGGRPAPGTVAMPAPVAAAAGRRLRRAVTHEHGHLVPRAVVDRARVDENERSADPDRLPRLGQQFDDAPGEGARELHNRLFRLHFDQDLIQSHLVPGGHVPGHDVRLGQALTEVGQGERADLGHGWRHRSTSWRMRSASGRKCCSARDAGYGEAKPPTRRTGDSRW